MSPPLWILVGGFAIFSLSAAFQSFKVIRRANVDDLSQGKGPILPGIVFSMIGAMSPLKKETAYLHLPTYAAGIVYHLGSFLAFFWLLLHVLGGVLPPLFVQLSILALTASSACGLAILAKRVLSAKLRHLSTPDDYFSNLLVTAFQILSGLTLWKPGFLPWLILLVGILLAYIPVGKLRHVIYFVIARFYLGVFYGKRGVWPPKRRNAWAKRPL